MSCAENKVLAAHCYPPCPESHKILGMGPHSDESFLTFLLKEPGATSKLQIKRNEEWLDINPIEDALIVNVGEFLQVR